MATGYLVLPMNGADIPDGSGSGNAAAAVTTLVSTGTPPTNAPKRTQQTWLMASSEHHIEWSWSLPGYYLSGGKIRVNWMMETASSGNVNLKAAAAIGVPLSTDMRAIVFDTVVASGAIAVPGTLGQFTETLLTLTMLNAAAGRPITVMLGSDGASWTASGNLIPISAMFEYVK